MKRTFKISISNKAYTSKLQGNEYNDIIFTKKVVSIFDFALLICKGYYFTSNFTDNNSFHISEKKKDNFTYSNYIGIDIESNSIEIPTFEEAWSKILLKPTIGYRTASDGIKGNRYRFVYFFDEPFSDQNLYEETYWRIISMLKQSYDFHTDDTCGKEVTRCFYGNTNCKNIQFDDIVYSLDDFMKYQPFQEEKKKKTTTVTIKEQETHLDNEIIKDFFEMTENELLHKYMEHYSLRSDNRIDFDFNKDNFALTNGQLIEYNYLFKKDAKGNFIKRIWRDGEQRRKKIMAYGSTIKGIYGDKLTFGQLLYSMVYYFSEFIDNTKDSFDKDYLYSLIEWVWTSGDETKYSDKKFILKKGLSKEDRYKALNLAKKAANYNRILAAYNPDLSTKENCKICKCSLNTLLAATGRKGSYKARYEAAKALYVNGMTARELKQVLEDNDIKVSRKTLFNYVNDFKKQYEISKTKNIKKVRNTFKKKVKNISVINYLNEMNNMIEITRAFRNDILNTVPFISSLKRSNTADKQLSRRGRDKPIGSFISNIYENNINFSPPWEYL